MNIIDNRTNLERLCDALTKKHDEINAALDMQIKAETDMKTLWADYLAACSGMPVDAGIIIVVSGCWLYEVKFDVDDFSQPQVLRIDGRVGIYKSDR